MSLLSLDHLSGPRRNHHHDRSHRLKPRRRKRKHKHRSGHSEETCAVCLSHETLDCMLLPCSHTFHGECISQWVGQNFSCPLCRQEITQFVPLQRKRNLSKAMVELEKLWREHYYTKDLKKAAKEEDKLKIEPVETVKTIIVDEVVKEEPKLAPVVELEPVPSQPAVEPAPVEEIVEIIPRKPVWDVLCSLISSQNKNGLVKPSLQSVVIGVSWLFPVSYEDSAEHSVDVYASSTQARGIAEWASPSVHAGGLSKPALATRNIQEASDGPSVAEPSIAESTLLNFRAGCCAGIAATIGSVAAMRSLNPRSAVLSCLKPTAKRTVPTFAVFFTSYEHLKKHLFQTDSQRKWGPQTFAERFISAGIAGSVASTVTSGALGPVWVRFATFFGTFESFKDMRSAYIDHKRPLNCGEVAAAAGAGGIVASSVYYPVTQVLTGVSAVSLAAGEGLTPTMKTGMYRGFARHLGHFLPSCVACSCMFEFSKRYFVAKD